MAKRRGRKCKRKKVSWQGVSIALPCGAKSLSSAHKAALDDEFTQAQWNKAKGGKCRVIFYSRDRVAMRCDSNRGGGMSRAAKKRFKRQLRAGDLCFKKRGRKRLFSNRC